MTNWSCVVDAFSYVIGVNPKTLIDVIGHDGSEIVSKSLPEPFCRKGFCLEEVYEALYKLGYSCMYLPKHITRVNNYVELSEDTSIDIVAKYLKEPMFVLHSKTHCIGCKNGVYNENKSITYEGIIIVSRILINL